MITPKDINRKKILTYKGRNPLYVFDDYLKSRFGCYAAGFIGELCGLLIGSAIGIGLLLLIF